jgi:hypothetical protein
MKDRESIKLLIQELENDLDYIKDSSALRARAVVRLDASLWDDDLDLMMMGSCLHGLYNSFEAYFLRVAKFFENNVDQHAWHRDLLDRMTLELPGIRPALISEPAVAERIDELRRFRHVFRNLYKTRIKAAKLRIVNDSADGLDEAFLPMHDGFMNWLETLAGALSGPGTENRREGGAA